MNTSDDRVYLQGIIKKDGTKWKMELPVINARSENVSIRACMEDIKVFISKGIQEIQEDVEIDMKVSDGGIVHVTTSDNQAFRQFIYNMTI